MKVESVIALLGVVVAVVMGDVFLHSPRGSNNRCDEQSNNRDNAARLFNSQNNAAGGYAVAPKMSYYEGSVLTVEWHETHSCNGSNCNTVLQYACESEMPGLRDGTPTGGLNNDGSNGGNTCTSRLNAASLRSDATLLDDDKYGVHESMPYFEWCNVRDRNGDLFTADETMRNDKGAQSTRQNNNGNTNGMECQEERDYYPYWHPSPFKDIAVLTSDTSRCDSFTSESQNVKGKHWCARTGYTTVPYKLTALPNTGSTNPDSSFASHNNRADCEAAADHEWVEEAAWGIPAPECVESYSAPGNTVGFAMSSYNWTLPAVESTTTCVLRVRYNVTSADYDVSSVTAADNGDDSPIKRDPYLQYHASGVDGAGNSDTQSYLRLALDTANFGRTFEDRTFVFDIKPRPDNLKGKTIYNLGVRGKRGNNSQVRMCLEYDFTPKHLHVEEGDYIHFQWTGSNHNNAGNDGEGRNRWDRSNVVQIASLAHNFPMSLDDQTLFDDKDTAYTLAFLGQGNHPSYDGSGAVENAGANVACKNFLDLEADNNDQDKSNCAKLNNIPTGHFDFPPVRMNTTDTYHYMSSRNNNLSSREHKGTITVWGSGSRLVGCTPPLQPNPVDNTQCVSKQKAEEITEALEEDGVSAGGVAGIAVGTAVVVAVITALCVRKVLSAPAKRKSFGSQEMGAV